MQFAELLRTGPPDPETLARYAKREVEKLKERHREEGPAHRERHAQEALDLQRRLEERVAFARRMGQAYSDILELRDRYPEYRTVAELIQAAYHNGLL